MTEAEKQQLVASVPYWFHSINLGDGIITPGKTPIERLEKIWEQTQITDLRGKTVLDIGAWDGFYSFKAEQLGASRVLAMDKYIWSLDMGRIQEFVPKFSQKDKDSNEYRMPKPHLIPGFYQPSILPTKIGFDTAHQILGSTVEQLVDDLVTVDTNVLGAFDVVLYLGGLYHMEDPFSALRKVKNITADVAYIETAGIEIPNLKDSPFFEFYENDELHHDYSNWWAGNEAGLLAMCRAVGFRKAEILCVSNAVKSGNVIRNRLLARAYA